MENLYGIGVTNRYALFLNEEEDPLEILKAQEREKEAKKKTKVSEKENRGKPEPKSKQAPIIRKVIKESQSLKALDIAKAKEENNKAKSTRPSIERNVKFITESREERNNRRNREDRPVQTGDFRETTRPDSGEGRGRGRGTGRGAGRGRGRGRGGYDIRGKREFDRQSGSDKSGVKPVDKREGGGAHNWGTYKDEIECTPAKIHTSLDSNIISVKGDSDREQIHTTHLTDEQTDWAVEKTEGDAPPAEPTEVKEETGGEGDTDNLQHPDEGLREITLDEWKAMRGNRQKPTFNIRKAGEGEDLTQWKKMYALKKKEGEEDDEEDEEYDATEYPQRVGRQKHLLDIDIHFADSRRGVRGRGRGIRGPGRGGPRGTPRAGGSRGTTLSTSRGPRQSAPKVDDERDFPSLG